MDVQTERWWTGLRAVSLVNIVLLALTAAWAPLESDRAWWQLVLCTVYVFVCAFRSFWPRVDLERVVLRDEPLSSIALGRSSATIAELAFTAQCAIWVWELGGRAELGWAQTLAWTFVPLIAAAQTACWTAVVTLDHRWHAAEELLWGLFMALLAAVFGASVMRVSGVDLGLVGLGLVATAAGAYVMLVLDVPMYFKRYAEEREKGAPTLAIADGIRDAMTRREPTGSWDVWKHEVAWMTPYFSAGVWLSLGMVWF